MTECRDGLFILVKSVGDIETAKSEKIESMYARGLTVQPYILLVGSALSNITASYVIINNYMYKTVSVSDALDFCFKVFHVLDAKYPFESEHIWLLIQKSVYKIDTKTDKKIPSIQDLF